MQFIFSNCGSLESKAIQWFEGSRFSHCALISNNGFVLQALWSGGVQVSPLSEFLDGTYDWAMFEVNVPDEAAALAFAQAQVGKPYDKTALFGIATFRDWQSDDAWYCSELCCAILKAGGLPLVGSYEYKRVGVRLALEFINGLKQGQSVKPSLVPPAN